MNALHKNVAPIHPIDEDVLSALDSLGLTYSYGLVPRYVKGTALFDENSEQGRHLLDFYTHTKDFREAAPSMLRDSVLEFLREPACFSVKNGDEIFFQRHWVHITVPKLHWYAFIHLLSLKNKSPITLNIYGKVNYRIMLTEVFRVYLTLCSSGQSFIYAKGPIRMCTRHRWFLIVQAFLLNILFVSLFWLCGFYFHKLYIVINLKYSKRYFYARGFLFALSSICAKTEKIVSTSLCYTSNNKGKDKITNVYIKIMSMHKTKW